MTVLSRRLFLALGGTALMIHRSLGKEADAVGLPHDLESYRSGPQV
jgi:hypothetical protein